MKKLFFVLLIAITAKGYSQIFNGGNGSVPDNQVKYFSANVSGMVPATLDATHGLVSVCLKMNHTYVSDITIHLIAPDSTEIVLTSGIGYNGDHYTNTCFSQTGTNVIDAGVPPYTGTFKPQETLGNLNNGQNGNGVWRLRVTDSRVTTSGFLLSWSLTFGNNAPTSSVFSSSNLPIVVINTNNVAIRDEPKISAKMGIIYNGPGVLNYVTDTPNNYYGDIGIEERGAFSGDLPQKPYTLETLDPNGLEANVSLLSMPAEHDWLLIANYNDKVFMRNTLAGKLFDDMGHYAARSRLCEVIINGNYRGVYLLSESIKRDKKRVDVAKLDTLENSGINLTGGYIIKNDYWTASDSWLSNFRPIDHPTFDVHYVYHYPKPTTITPQQKTYIQSFMNDLEAELYSSNFKDPVTGYKRYMSINSFVDYLIVNELARNVDGFKKSQFFHKDKDTVGKEAKLKAGPVWDFDWAWKNVNECFFSATNGSGWSHLVNDCGGDVANSSGWYIRLLQDTSFQNLFRCRWNNFRTTILSDASINNYIDSVALYVDTAQARHFARWANLGVNTGTPEVGAQPTTFAGQITQFKDWITTRIGWLDLNIPGNPASCALATSLNDQKETADLISIYPNPAKDVLQIRSGTKLTGRMQLCDLTGKVIMQIENNNATNLSIDILTLSEGIYFCKFFTEKEIVKVEKVVVMR